MGTRSEIQFFSKNDRFQVYKQYDGHVLHTLEELAEFLKWNGDRMDNAAMLISNYILWYRIHVSQLHSEDDGLSIEERFNAPAKSITSSALRFNIHITDVKEYEEIPDIPYIEYFYKVDIDKKEIIIYADKIFTVKFDEINEKLKELKKEYEN